jgi:internalin A
MEDFITFLKSKKFTKAEKLGSLKVTVSPVEKQDIDVDIQSPDLRYFLEDGKLVGLHISGHKFEDEEWRAIEKGLSEATDLQVLYSSGTPMREIDFRNFDQLSFLLLHDSQRISKIHISSENSHLEELRVSGCKSLTDVILNGDFPKIKIIEIINNAVTSLHLRENMPSLRYLNFSQNEIFDLKLPVAPALAYLYAQTNVIEEISLEKFPTIELVDLTHNALSQVTFPKDSKSLTTLDLNDNLLEEFCLIGNFQSLHSIEVSNNKVASFNLSGLFPCLNDLNISNNALSKIDLGVLPSLVNLQIQDNSLVDKKLIQTVLSNCINIELFDMHDNATGIPEHIIDYCRPKEILDYLEEEEKGVSEKNIFKVILIGNGCAGKTTLWEWLDQKEFIKIEESDRTHGIVIGKWKHPYDESYEFNVWDFAGQEVYHPMHRLFMTERTVYVAVWATERPCTKDQNQLLGYWIDYIADMSPHSHIITLQNLFNQQLRHDLDELSATNRNEYEQKGIKIAELEAINLKTASVVDLKEVEDKILRTAEKIKNEVTKEDIPLTWYNVAKELEKKSDEDRISWTDYLHICGQQGISEGGEKTLLSYLHNTGVIFYNEGCWEDEIILNQAKLLEPIYALLKGNFKAYLHWIDLTDKWHGCIDKEIEFLIGFMEKCQILFKQHPENKWWGDFKEATFIIPQFLPYKNQIRPESFKSSYNLQLSISYPFWHQTIFDKLLIVLMKFANSEGDISRNFAEFKYKEVDVLFHTDLKSKTVNLFVKGGDETIEKGVLEEIRKELDSLKKLTQAKEIYTNLKTPDESYNREEWQQMSKDIQVNRMSDKPKFFISYANADKEFFEHFLNELIPATKDKWEIWTDKNIPIGENWRKEIEAAIRICDYALLAVSNRFLASEFIQKVELAKFVKKAADEKSGFRFFPFLLRPCEISDLEEFENLSSTQFFKSLGGDYGIMSKETHLISLAELLHYEGGKYRSNGDKDVIFINKTIQSQIRK